MQTPFLEKGVFMKKGLIVAVLIVVLMVIVAVAFILVDKLVSDKDNTQADAPYSDSQIGITVDSWLKIIEIRDFDGKLAVIAENVSETDVEYAVLTVKTSTDELTFNVSALLSGTRAILICNEDISSNPDENYTSWGIENKIVFENPPSMHEDAIEVEILNGSVSLKNISDEAISSHMYVYYKEKHEDLLNGSYTGRFKVYGLKADSETFVKAEKLNGDNCQIIFIDYDD